MDTTRESTSYGLGSMCLRRIGSAEVFARLRDRFDVGSLWGWLLLGVSVGVALGWLAGSWTTCSVGGSCEPRIASIEAVGTWVGGLATTGALLLTAHQLGEGSRRRHRTALIDARRSALRLRAIDEKDGRFLSVEARLENKSTRDLVDVALLLDGEIIEGEHQIHPGKTRWFTLRVNGLGISELPSKPETRSGQILREMLGNRLEVSFELDGYRFVRSLEGTLREA